MPGSTNSDDDFVMGETFDDEVVQSTASKFGHYCKKFLLLIVLLLLIAIFVIQILVICNVNKVTLANGFVYNSVVDVSD